MEIMKPLNIDFFPSYRRREINAIAELFGFRKIKLFENKKKYKQKLLDHFNNS